MSIARRSLDQQTSTPHTSSITQSVIDAPARAPQRPARSRRPKAAKARPILPSQHAARRHQQLACPSQTAHAASVNAPAPPPPQRWRCHGRTHPPAVARRRHQLYLHPSVLLLISHAASLQSVLLAPATRAVPSSCPLSCTCPPPCPLHDSSHRRVADAASAFAAGTFAAGAFTVEAFAVGAFAVGAFTASAPSRFSR